MCQLSQSPINLQAYIQAQPLLDLQLHWKLSSGVIERTDHGLEIVFPYDPTNYASLNGKPFLLRGMHFHYPSEHFLDGRKFDAELHIVHQNSEDASYMVLGVFLEIVDKFEEDEEEITSFAKAVKDNARVIDTMPLNWVPAKDARVLRYEGSLTTSPYTETVSWAVLKESKKITQAIFNLIFGSAGPHARDLQPLNRRYILEYKWNK